MAQKGKKSGQQRLSRPQIVRSWGGKGKPQAFKGEDRDTAVENFAYLVAGIIGTGLASVAITQVMMHDSQKRFEETMRTYRMSIDRSNSSTRLLQPGGTRQDYKLDADVDVLKAECDERKQ